MKHLATLSSSSSNNQCLPAGGWPPRHFPERRPCLSSGRGNVWKNRSNGRKFHRTRLLNLIIIFRRCSRDVGTLLSPATRVIAMTIRCETLPVFPLPVAFWQHSSRRGAVYFERCRGPFLSFSPSVWSRRRRREACCRSRTCVPGGEARKTESARARALQSRGKTRARVFGCIIFYTI